MEQYMLAVVCWCLAATATLAVVLLVGQWKVSTRLRSQIDAYEAGANLRDEELRHLVANRLPALAESMYGRPVEIPGPVHAGLADTAYGRYVEMVASTFADATDQAKARAEKAAKATLKSMMRGVQSLANEQQLAISKMQEQHDDPDVLEGLLQIDHMNAQLGRRAQASAVLCGSWPGQQRSASSAVDVVRGATSRIRDYLRVQVNPHVNVAVISRAVEPVVLALAELLDNAARHSQPNAPVEVNFQQAHNGTAIVIDDAGVAMTPEELERAARLLSGEEAVDINRLGDPPQVGFAVVGVLAARYGFSVSVDTRSPYGGVRAVVFLPTALLTRVDDVPKVAVKTPAVSEPAPQAPSSEAAETPPPVARTVGGLPRRRRASTVRQTVPDDGPGPDTASSREPGQAEDPAAHHTTIRPAEPADPPLKPARQAAAGLGAWQRGTRSGRATVPPDSEGNLPA